MSAYTHHIRMKLESYTLILNPTELSFYLPQCKNGAMVAVTAQFFCFSNTLRHIFIEMEFNFSRETRKFTRVQGARLFNPLGDNDYHITYFTIKRIVKSCPSSETFSLFQLSGQPPSEFKLRGIDYVNKIILAFKLIDTNFSWLEWTSEVKLEVTVTTWTDQRVHLRRVRSLFSVNCFAKLLR